MLRNFLAYLLHFGCTTLHIFLLWLLSWLRTEFSFSALWLRSFASFVTCIKENTASVLTFTNKRSILFFQLIKVSFLKYAHTVSFFKHYFLCVIIITCIWFGISFINIRRQLCCYLYCSYSLVCKINSWNFLFCNIFVYGLASYFSS